MTVDILTKPLSFIKLKKFTRALGLFSVWGGVLGFKPYVYYLLVCTRIATAWSAVVYLLCLSLHILLCTIATKCLRLFSPPTIIAANKKNSVVIQNVDLVLQIRKKSEQRRGELRMGPQVQCENTSGAAVYCHVCPFEDLHIIKRFSVTAAHWPGIKISIDSILPHLLRLECARSNLDVNFALHPLPTRSILLKKASLEMPVVQVRMHRKEKKKWEITKLNESCGDCSSRLVATSVSERHHVASSS